MLVLGRREGQSITIGDNIHVRVLEAKDGKVRLGIDAPKDVPIVRDDMVNSEPKERTYFPDV